MKAATPPRARWKIWVDTGGTFTDAVGIDPEGGFHRTKILSSSGLRGAIRSVPDPRHLSVRQSWGLPDDGVRGFRFRLLDPPGVSRTVAAFDATNSTLTLEGDLEKSELEQLSPGKAFEILSPEPAPVLAARILTRTPPGASLPETALRLGTTRGTNALLTRGGARVALFITEGFGDLLRIGTQQRPDLFALRIERPEPLYEAVVEVPERVAADGEILRGLDADALRPQVKRLLAAGIRAAAVALLHSDRHPAHERELGRFLEAAGMAPVCWSSDLSGTIQILPRAETAVAEAYLSPVVDDYLLQIQACLDSAPAGPVRPGSTAFHVLTSAGGLVRAPHFRATDGLLSGPAGGVVGAARAGLAAGSSRILSFDMGGTSTDVARFDGDFEYVHEHGVAGVRLRAPALAIESVAAGGGSICHHDGTGVAVGPRSAGAVPGPACYGAGGPLTITDCNLLLGRLDPARFGIPIDPRAARVAAEDVARSVERAGGGDIGLEPLVHGFVEIANERMASAIRRISFRLGYDPADYALLAFGGAGGQHACGVAGRLGTATVLIPPDPGLLSAIGLGSALVERFASRQILAPLDQARRRIRSTLRELDREAISTVRADTDPGEDVQVRRRIAALRFLGQESAVEVEIDDPNRLAASFEQRYRTLFAHWPVGRRLELVSLRVLASTRAAEPETPAPIDEAEQNVLASDDAVARRALAPIDAVERKGLGSADTPRRKTQESIDPADREVPGARGKRKAFFSGEWIETPTFLREEISDGSVITGPALLFEAHSATVVEPGWKLEALPDGTLRMTRQQIRATTGAKALGTEAAETEEARTEGVGTEAARTEAPGTAGSRRQEAAEVRSALFSHRLETIAREMGENLRRTAVSTNVKERLDFSCGILDRHGSLVVNAPHIPVHLGSLGLCVRSVKERLPLEAGDAVVTNHPAFGGSHLPDLTVISPAYSAEGRLIAYVASRAHHAEIGGTVPGSMPVRARSLAEEGVVLLPTYLIRRGESRENEVRALLLGAPYPTRAIEDNLADLRAAVAANQAGVRALRRLAEAHGADVLDRQMEELEGRAARRVRAALLELADGTYTGAETMDDGSPIETTLRIRDGRMTLRLHGSPAPHPGNLNATAAIVRSVVIYVLRLLVRDPIPLNEGMMRAVRLTISPGMLDPAFPEDPREAPAVFGGNVETSQRIVDALLRALRLAAGSQGTMNNLVIGDERFSYYETVGGGSGAGPGFAGCAGVHSHMTNTRITDPEILEHRYPVRLERFAIRAGSGGRGRFPGGDGLVRELRFLRPVSVSILSQRRSVPPYGLEGGEPGRPGRQQWIRANGEVRDLEAIDGMTAAAGDRLLLETPGGGGYGAPDLEAH